MLVGQDWVTHDGPQNQQISLWIVLNQQTKPNQDVKLERSHVIPVLNDPVEKTAPEWLKEIDAQQQGTKATQVPPDGPLNSWGMDCTLW